MVNNVCFPLPLPFFPLPPTATNPSSAIAVASSCATGGPLPHTERTASPRIFRRLALPDTCCLTRAAGEGASCGNADDENDAGLTAAFAPGPGTDRGTATATGAAAAAGVDDELPDAAPEADHAVLCGVPTLAGGGTEGRSTGNAGGSGTAPGTLRVEVDDEDDAAWATRSQTLGAVARFALMTRPAVTSANPSPLPPGTRSGNCLRCYQSQFMSQ